MFKIFFEDLEIGHSETYGTYPVTREEIIEFASKYDPQPFHLDDEMAKMSPFGRLCASGWHTCAMAMRLVVDHLMETGLAGMGSPGLEELRWRRPVFPGDTLSVRSEVIGKEDMPKRPNLGLMRSGMDILNQDGDVVATWKSRVMVMRRKPVDA